VAQTLLQEFITLWVVVDPIGTVPVFLAATSGLTTAERRRVAVRSVLIAGAVLFGFIVLGQIVLESAGIGLPSFRIAGGIVLFLFAMTMIFGTSKPAAELAGMDRVRAAAVFPVAIPSIASPGAMLAVVILTDNDRFSVTQQAYTTGVLALVLAITLVLLLLASPIHRLIGLTGEMIISRVMGMVLAAVAVQAVLTGFVGLGVIAPF
jgi:multiple antibiotic resistance protein